MAARTERPAVQPQAAHTVDVSILEEYQSTQQGSNHDRAASTTEPHAGILVWVHQGQHRDVEVTYGR